MRTGRPPTEPRTALGAAIRARRGERSAEDVAGEIGIRANTIYRIERGETVPSDRSARALAVWLGWSAGQVRSAARVKVG